MPIHDWTKVDAGIFHAFHHGWIEELSRALNRKILPPDYYALIEQLPRQTETGSRNQVGCKSGRLNKSVIAVRRRLKDGLVAQIEVISPDDKDMGRNVLSVADRIWDLLKMEVHTLILDLLPPGPFDVNGIHNAIWRSIGSDDFAPPSEKFLTIASYESHLEARAYVEPLSVGDQMPDMPLFLEQDHYVVVPLEPTYQVAFAEVPRRWRTVLEPSAS